MAVGGRTVGRVMSRTILWLVALGVVVLVGAAGVAWRINQSEPAAPSVEAKPVTAVAVAPVIPAVPAFAAPTCDWICVASGGVTWLGRTIWNGIKWLAAGLNRLLDASQKPFYLLLCIQRWLELVLDLTVAVLTILLVGLAVALRHSVNAGLLGVARS